MKMSPMLRPDFEPRQVKHLVSSRLEYSYDFIEDEFGSITIKRRQLPTVFVWEESFNWQSNVNLLKCVDFVGRQIYNEWQLLNGSGDLNIQESD